MSKSSDIWQLLDKHRPGADEPSDRIIYLGDAQDAIPRMLIYDRDLSEKEIVWTQQDLTAEATRTLAAKRTGSQQNIARTDILPNIDGLFPNNSNVRRTDRRPFQILTCLRTFSLCGGPPCSCFGQLGLT